MDGRISRVVRPCASLLGLVVLGWVMTGRAARPIVEGLPTDWTHRHVIFSQPTTEEERQRVAGDPRYWQQWYRQNFVRVLASGSGAGPEAGWPRDRVEDAQVQSLIQSDWAQSLGAAGSTVGATNFPAKYSFGVNTANCASAATPDFVVYSTGLTGSNNQASIIAFDNLYSGCTAPVPNTYWAYNTGAQILTSPVFSRDGTQLAFVQTNGTDASLVLLKWTASTTETVLGPGSPFSATPAQYPTSTCVVPCMTTIALQSGGATPANTNDTLSSPFYDYVGDTLWVGDGSGWLHQFNPVFLGTSAKPPAEIRNTTWPVQVNKTTPKALDSPVHDLVSGNVFVGDQGGFLYSVSASTGNVVALTAKLDAGPAASVLVSGPIVDRTTETVYMFSSNDGTTNCAGAACSAVFQVPAAFIATTTPQEAHVGTSSAAADPLYDGSFDSNYYSSGNGTGNLYVCGNTGGDPTLYRLPIATGTFGTAESVAPVSGGHHNCAPVTDMLNPNATLDPNGDIGPEERVFFGVVTDGHPTVCTTGCAISFVNLQWQPDTAYKVGQEILVFRTANDIHYINVVTQAGTSGGTAPTWPGRRRDHRRWHSSLDEPGYDYAQRVDGLDGR